MKVDVLHIPIRCKNLYKDTVLSIYPSSNKAELFEDVDAKDYGESIYQLVEGCTYEYAFADQEFSLGKLKEVVYPSRRGAYGGLIKTGIYVGTLKLKVMSDHKEVAEVELEVKSVKMDYRQDYQKMLEDITAYYTELVMIQGAPVTQKFEVDFTRDKKILYQKFAFVKSIVESETFCDAIHKIQSNPVRKWTETIVERHISNVKRMGRDAMKQISRNPNRVDVSHMNMGMDTIPRTVKVPYKKDTVDTLENQFVKYVLMSFMSFCSHIQTLKNAGERLKREAAITAGALGNYLSFSLFKEVSMPSMLSLNSPALQRKEGYREVLQAWLIFDLAAKLSWHGGDDVYDAGKRNVATLYEYWLFFKLMEVIGSIFDIAPEDKKNLVQTDKDEINLELKQGKMKMVHGVYDAGVRKLNVRFYYNRTFKSAGSMLEAGSWTRTMRPDYTLSVWPGEIDEKEAEKEDLIVHIHFDAKYKLNRVLLKNENEDDSEECLNEEKEQQELGVYKEVDLYKMHTYKDAIRRTGGAYILYPGDTNKQMIGFHEIIPGLGAFCIKPNSSEVDMEPLKQFIKDVIHHLLDRTSQREKMAYYRHKTYNVESKSMVLHEALPEPYGDNRDLLPDDTYVLIGYYKNEEHLKWIEKSGLYNTRTGTQIGSLPLCKELVSTKYLLLHHGGKSSRFIKLKDAPRIMMGKDLAKKGYPYSSEEEKEDKSSTAYVVFKLDDANTEKVFEDYSWDIKNLELKTGNQSAVPQYMSLAELVKRRNK